VIEAARRGFAEEWARLSKERSRESAAAERTLQDARREAARLSASSANGVSREQKPKSSPMKTPCPLRISNVG